MKNELLLLAGSDIPFPEARVTIHQPTLKEIGYIGEKAFFMGCGFLDFSKNLLNQTDKIRLANYNDFDILMSIMINKEKSVRDTVESAMLVLSLIFPLYEVTVRKDKVAIILIKDGQEFEINKSNFPAFKEIVIEMFNLKPSDGSADKYNPQGDMAKRIAEKFKKRQEQLNKLKEEIDPEKGVSILSRYASILAVGLQKDLNELMQYTVYQLYDEFQRFQLKVQWDAYIEARMAGAKDLEEVDNWMIDLKDQGKQKNKKTKK
jgi:hypothetical protein